MLHRPPPWLKALVITAILFLFGASANATTYTVNSLADPTDPGFTTLRDAINLATSPGDLINFSVSGTIVLASTLPNITNPDLTIDGGNNITVSGNNLVQVMIVEPGAGLTLENITIAEGKTGNVGGGIFNSGTLTVSNSTIRNNTAGAGGGIFNFGTLILNNNTISNNTANIGGGVYNDRPLKILTIKNSTFFRNRGLLVGGAIENGGIATITNSTFSENSADGPGGAAIDTFDGDLKTTNVTFVENAAPQGATIFKFLDAGTITLQNTIIANSTITDCSGTIIADSSNMANDNTCGAATQVTLAALNLGPLQNNGGPTDTIALLSRSVAIDAGNNVYALAAGLIFDQRGPGFSRYINGVVDVGAFEFQATPSLLKSFFPPVITTNATSTLTITLNFTPNAELTSPFTDNLPTNLSIVGAATTTCGLPISNTASSITLNPPPNPPGILPLSGTCTITATVTSAVPGVFDNIIPAGALVVAGSPTTQTVSSRLFVKPSSCFSDNNCR